MKPCLGYIYTQKNMPDNPVLAYVFYKYLGQFNATHL